MFLVGLVVVVGQRRFRGDIDEQMISQVDAIDILQNNQTGSFTVHTIFLRANDFSGSCNRHFTK